MGRLLATGRGAREDTRRLQCSGLAQEGTATAHGTRPRPQALLVGRHRLRKPGRQAGTGGGAARAPASCPGALPGDASLRTPALAHPSCRESIVWRELWPSPRAPAVSVRPAPGPGLEAVSFQSRSAPRPSPPLRLGAEPSALPALGRQGCGPAGGATQRKGRPREQPEGGVGTTGRGAARGRAGGSLRKRCRSRGGREPRPVRPSEASLGPGAGPASAPLIFSRVSGPQRDRACYTAK